MIYIIITINYIIIWSFSSISSIFIFYGFQNITNILRVYRVCIANRINEQDVKKICSGLSINGIIYNKIEVIVEKTNNKKTWLKFKLREGKNREIRNICKYFKWPILKLIRLQYGSIRLRKEKPGEIKEIETIPKDFL